MKDTLARTAMQSQLNHVAKLFANMLKIRLADA